jgi:hypothetical protein
MASKHIDKLVRSFLGSSQAVTEFDQFNDLQDPTYVSFRINFFPVNGMSILDDEYSSGGLLRPSNNLYSDAINGYGDNAADYLGSIGSPTRQASHRAFVNMLYRIQEESPWYFQSITGLGDLYKIDPAMNFRGKDKVLTIECLESIDMRMTYLADLYRNFAFDTQWHREILPVNLRTFNMEIHVLEFRTFNTTFGIIADALSGANQRATWGEANQKAALNSANVYGSAASGIGSSLFTNSEESTRRITNALGGLGGIFGSQYESSNLESAFEAITVQTFLLKDCEFDFYSEAPGYLDNVSVKDIPEATNKFKINVGRIEKRSAYPFFNFIVGEYIKSTAFNDGDITSLIAPGSVKFKKPYIEQGAHNTMEVMNSPSDIRESVFPTQDGKRSVVAAYNDSHKEQSNLQRRFLERALDKVVGVAADRIDAAIDKKVGELTGGVLGTVPLGNVYGKDPLIDNIRNTMIDFLTPGNQNPNSGEITEDFILRDARNILERGRSRSENVSRNIMEDAPTHDNLTGTRNILEEPSQIKPLDGTNNNLEKPTSPEELGDENVYNK